VSSMVGVGWRFSLVLTVLVLTNLEYVGHTSLHLPHHQCPCHLLEKELGRVGLTAVGAAGLMLEAVEAVLVELTSAAVGLAVVDVVVVGVVGYVGFVVGLAVLLTSEVVVVDIVKYY